MLSASGLIAGALTFTVALAWNDAVSKAMTNMFPRHNERALFAYALLITLVVIVIAAAVNFTMRRTAPASCPPPTRGGLGSGPDCAECEARCSLASRLVQIRPQPN